MEHGLPSPEYYHDLVFSVPILPSSTQDMSKSRSWCYTLNNYTDDELALIRAFEAAYQVIGFEVGEQGTPHLQGYIQWKNPRTLKGMKKLMPRAHLERRMGTIDQAVDYCKKDGKFEEYGTKPLTQTEKGLGEKQRWMDIIDAAEKGDEEWLKENHPNVYFRQLNVFRSHKKKKTEIADYSNDDTPHEWWWGPTGTGKSKKLWEDFPEHYQKEQNKWWDGYQGEDVVAIEEASPETMKYLASRLKVWADRYPFPGEIKGGRMNGIRPKKIIVLSNYPLEACFPGEADAGPLRRRFKEVKFGQVSPWSDMISVIPPP